MYLNVKVQETRGLTTLSPMAMATPTLLNRNIRHM